METRQCVSETRIIGLFRCQDNCLSVAGIQLLSAATAAAIKWTKYASLHAHLSSNLRFHNEGHISVMCICFCCRRCCLVVNTHQKFTYLSSCTLPITLANYNLIHRRDIWNSMRIMSKQHTETDDRIKFIRSPSDIPIVNVFRWVSIFVNMARVWFYIQMINLRHGNWRSFDFFNFRVSMTQFHFRTIENKSKTKWN